MEKQYYVICSKDYNIADIEAELSSSEGNEYIPARECNCSVKMSNNDRMSVWSLTKNEAIALNNDPRILNVRDKDDVIDTQDDGEGVQQTSDSSSLLPDTYTVEQVRQSASRLAFNAPMDKHSEYEESKRAYWWQADGEGVDIVVADRAFNDVNYTELLDDDGLPRLQKVNWYEMAGDPDGLADTFDSDRFYEFEWSNNVTFFNYENDVNVHGLKVATAAAGRNNGFAKKAAIYNASHPRILYNSIEADGSTGVGVLNKSGIDTVGALNCVLAWHQSKMAAGGNQRPTVVVKSQTDSKTISGSYGLPVRGSYRGNDWLYDGETKAELFEKYKLPLPASASQNVQVGYSDGSHPEEVLYQQLIDAGVHVVTSSTNTPTYQDVDPNGNSPMLGLDPNAGLDYNNYVVFNTSIGEQTFYYNRPVFPHADGMIKCGALSSNTNEVDSGGFGAAVPFYLRSGSYVPSPFNFTNTETSEVVFEEGATSGAVVLTPTTVKKSNTQALSSVQSYNFKPNAETPVEWYEVAFSGTSNSAPVLAGILACILEKEPTLTPKQAQIKLQDVCKELAEVPTSNDRDHDDNVSLYHIPFMPYSKNKALSIEGEAKVGSGHNPWLANSYIEILGGNDSEIQLGVTAYKEIRLHLRDDDGNKIDPALINAMGGGTWSSGIQQIVPNQLIVNDNQVLNTSWYYGSNPITDGYFKATYNTPDVLGTYVITAKVRGEFIAQDPASITRGFDDTVKPIASVSTDYDKVVVGDNLGNNRVSAYYINNVPENVQEIAAVLVNDEFAENPTLTVTSISDGLVYENNFLSVPSSTDYATAQSYQADFVMTDGINSHSFTVYVNVIDQTAPFVNFSSSHGVVSQNGYDVTLTVNEDIGSGLSLLGVSIIDSGTTTATFTSNSS
jgi:hypothetical protein